EEAGGNPVLGYRPRDGRASSLLSGAGLVQDFGAGFGGGGASPLAGFAGGVFGAASEGGALGWAGGVERSGGGGGVCASLAALAWLFAVRPIAPPSFGHSSTEPLAIFAPATAAFPIGPGAVPIQAPPAAA